MTDMVSFNARAIFTIAPDRIYRIELRNGSIYFLRIGGQFDVDRGHSTPAVPGRMPAALILAAGEALFRKHQKEELIARDLNLDPEDLLRIHPHNFKLAPTAIRQATLLPKKWFLALFRRHYGRLVLDLTTGERWEFHFETDEDLRTALTSLGDILGDKLTAKVAWDSGRNQ